MARYWRIHHDADGYLGLITLGQIFVPQDLYLVDGGLDFSCIPNDMRFRFQRKKGKSKPDFLLYNNWSLLCRNEILDVFIQQCKIDIYRSELKIDDKLHTLVTVKTELSAFDPKRSIFTLFEDGDNIFTMDKLRLKPDFETDYDLFRLSEYYALRTELFCSDKFKKVYEDNGFTGLEFYDATR